MDNLEKKKWGMGISSLLLFITSIAKTNDLADSGETTRGQFWANLALTTTGLFFSYKGFVNYPLSLKRARELGNYEAFKFKEFAEKSSVYANSTPATVNALSQCIIPVTAAADVYQRRNSASAQDLIQCVAQTALNHANTPPVNNIVNLVAAVAPVVAIADPDAASALIRGAANHQLANPTNVTSADITTLINLIQAPAHISVDDIVANLNAASQTAAVNQETLDQLIYHETWRGSEKDVGALALAISAIFSSEMRKIKESVPPNPLPTIPTLTSTSTLKNLIDYENAIKVHSSANAYNEALSKRSDAGWNMVIVFLVGSCLATMNNRLPTETEVEKAKIDAYINKLRILLP